MNIYTSSSGTKYFLLNPINKDYAYNWDGDNGIDYLYCQEDGSKNLLHREDGAAIEFFNADQLWYFHGKLIDCKSQEEFEKIIKMKAFI